mmetsp:Transcript_29499/g.94729  ORF Transcript_29499/g.94729 Transcript_29499/m.94729 type:complete len:249 (+) Transcript_29499:729-1475(+)
MASPGDRKRPRTDQMDASRDASGASGFDSENCSGSSTVRQTPSKSASASMGGAGRSFTSRPSSSSSSSLLSSKTLDFSPGFWLVSLADTLALSSSTSPLQTPTAAAAGPRRNAAALRNFSGTAKLRPLRPPQYVAVAALAGAASRRRIIGAAATASGSASSPTRYPTWMSRSCARMYSLTPQRSASIVMTTVSRALSLLLLASFSKARSRMDSTDRSILSERYASGAASNSSSIRICSLKKLKRRESA